MRSSSKLKPKDWTEFVAYLAEEDSAVNDETTTAVEAPSRVDAQEIERCNGERDEFTD